MQVPNLGFDPPFTEGYYRHDQHRAPLARVAQKQRVLASSALVPAGAEVLPPIFIRLIAFFAFGIAPIAAHKWSLQARIRSWGIALVGQAHRIFIIAHFGFCAKTHIA